MLKSVAIVSYFNSIKVRLELRNRIKVNTKQSYFNSIKVRLELPLLCLLINLFYYFNSIKVRLEPWLNKMVLLLLNFNSIKVRLEPRRVHGRYVDELFQFHKGTIRTLFVNNPAFIVLRFQFHKGTIRTPMPTPSFARMYYFNSIKVRLERFIERAAGGAATFQFHKGTIRTIQALRLRRTL